MTRTTLKALWVGGGGILATWLAVSPNQTAPATSPAASVARPAQAGDPSPEDLHAQTTRLRQRNGSTPLPASTRNPFRFSASKAPLRTTAAPVMPADPAVAAAVQAAPAAPALTLSGVAQKAGVRTAVISGDGQIYLAGEGDAVAGRYTVVKIDPEAVLLRDAAGAERRLVLPQ